MDDTSILSLPPQLYRRDSFDEPLQDLKRRLTEDENKSFQCVSARDVHIEVSRIQKHHETDRTMQNFMRLRPFLEGMEHLERVVVILGIEADVLAYIWGPMKYMLRIVSDKMDLLDILLDAYEKIGESFIWLEQYTPLVGGNPQLMKIIGMIYSDLLEFHEKALRLYSGKGRWRQLFRSQWKDFEPLLTHLLKRLSDHKGALSDLVGLSNWTQGQEQHKAIVERINEYEMRRAKEWQQFVDVDNHRRDQDFLSVIEWLAPSPNTIIEHEMLCKEREKYPGSGSWLLKSDKVVNWLEGDPPTASVLWLHGIPGAGKTVLASRVIEHCKEQTDMTTAYFYCREGDAERNDCLSIYKGLLAQLVTQQRALVPYFLEKRCTSGTVVLSSQAVAEQLLASLLDLDTTFYLVVDGLDECEPAQVQLFMEYLRKLVAECDEHKPGKLRFMLVSQNVKDIKAALSPESTTFLEIRPVDNKNDIEMYVRYWAEKLQRDHELGIEQLGTLVLNTCGRSNGMFLFAKLVMLNLTACETYAELIDELNADVFPLKLKDAYVRILGRLQRNLHPRQWTLVKKLLGWIICAKRPLKWKEIQAVLSIDHEQECFNFRELGIRSDVEQLCGSLVRVLKAERPEDNRIELIHVTARRHIVETSMIQKALTELELTTLCLRYLLWEGFDPTFDVHGQDGPPTVEQTKQHLRDLIMKEHFILQDYVVSKWSHHVSAILDVDPHDLSTRDGGIPALNAFGTALEDFRNVHDEDISKYEPSEKDEKACQNFIHYDDLYIDLLQLWNHIRDHNERGLHARNEPSLKRIAEALTRNREHLETLYIGGSKKEETNLDARKITRIYGKSVFKCSKLTCFYFYAGFNNRVDRNRHVKRHDRPFECVVPDCTMQDVGFMSNKDLDRHRKFFHPEAGDLAETFVTAKKPLAEAKFPCTLCNRRFTRGANLRAHQRVHAGERPFACSDCGKAFTRANDCRRHEKNHAAKR